MGTQSTRERMQLLLRGLMGSQTSRSISLFRCCCPRVKHFIIRYITSRAPSFTFTSESVTATLLPPRSSVIPEESSVILF